MLVSPQRGKVKLVVQLGFQAFNNEVEYEALLIELRAIKAMEASKVEECFDSWLVTHQLNSAYEVRCEKLKKYIEEYEQAKEDFSEIVP